MNKFEVGDTVLYESRSGRYFGEVFGVTDRGHLEYAIICRQGEHTDAFFSMLANEKELSPAKIEVGDRVEPSRGGKPAIVEHISKKADKEYNDRVALVRKRSEDNIGFYYDIMILKDLRLLDKNVENNE